MTLSSLKILFFFGIANTITSTSLVHGSDLLTEESLPLNIPQSTSCGGVLEGSTGLISYKLGLPLGKDEVCLWTIEAGGLSNVALKLVSNGFHTNENTPITIYKTPNFSANSKYDKIEYAAYMGPRRPLEVNVTGSLLYILFEPSSDYENQTGFALLYEGYGGPAFTQPFHQLMHVNTKDTPSGFFQYNYNKTDAYPYEYPLFSLVFQPPISEKGRFRLTVENFVNELPCTNGTFNEEYDYIREIHVYELVLTSTGTDVTRRLAYGNRDEGPFKSTMKYPTIFYFGSSSSHNPSISIDISWEESEPPQICKAIRRS